MPELAGDNQWWYTGSTLKSRVKHLQEITLIVNNRPCRMRHAKPGHDGRPTHSFSFVDREDLAYWIALRGQLVDIALAHPGEEQPGGVRALIPPQRGAADANANQVPAGQPETVTLCLGLDSAWFGGAANDPLSQFDCIASTVIGGAGQPVLALTRVDLRAHNRDPEAALTSAAILGIIGQHNDKRTILALDAPIQAVQRQNLPGFRPANPGPNKVQRRACEQILDRDRRAIDEDAGGANRWNPNIQPGAPLAKRVTCLLNILQGDEKEFALWTRGNRAAKKLVIECFPAEAIWAAKRLGGYAQDITATYAKAYKHQHNVWLNAQQVKRLTHDALDGFAGPSGDPNHWNCMVKQAIDWMLKDPIWQRQINQVALYRGGKPFDDVVDTMICLATSLSCARQCAHVWQDPAAPDDGHIIGPGSQTGGDCVRPFVQA